MASNGSGKVLDELKGPLKRLVFLESERKKASTKLATRISAISKWQKKEATFVQPDGSGAEKQFCVIRLIFVYRFPPSG